MSQKVKQIAEDLVSIFEMGGVNPNLFNFLYSGKTLDHNLTLGENNIQSGAKIITTMKRVVNKLETASEIEKKNAIKA